MEMTSYVPGTPSWVDLMVPDIDKATTFYSSLFGWNIPEGNEEFGGYRNAELRGKKVCGLMAQHGDGHTVWSSYVSTDDAAAALSRAEAKGATVIVPAMPVGDLGVMGVFIDPTGAACGVWQPNEHIGAELVNEAGAFCWTELSTRDVPAATAFYEAVFGWAHHTSDGDMPYTEFKLGADTIGGMMEMPPGVPAEVPPHWLVYFAVDNCDASIEKVKELGGQLLVGPMDIHIGRFAVLTDDQDATFAVIALDETEMAAKS